jgi:hypothetical protein
MGIITSRINNDLRFNQLVRTRYQKTISALQDKGFDYLGSYSEAQFPFSLLVLTPIYWMMRSKREVTRISSPLRVTAYYPLLVHRETDSIALVNGLHSKFYTQFGDGTVIITVNAGTKNLFDTEKRIYKASFPGTEAQTWEKHQEWRAEFLKAGKEVKKSDEFDDYCDMSIRENKTFETDVLLLAAAWVSIIMVLGGLSCGLLFWFLILPLLQ